MKRMLSLGLIAALTVVAPHDSFAANYTCQKAGLGKSFFNNVRSQVKAALEAANIKFKKITVKATDIERDTLTVDEVNPPSIPITVTDTTISFGSIPSIVPAINRPCEVEKNIKVTVIKGAGAASVVGEFRIESAGRFVKAP